MQIASTERADRPVPVLVGNGELATTLDRFGYQSPDINTNRFVLAGRRHAGPHHELVDFGRITRAVECAVAGVETVHEQILFLEGGEVRSRSVRGPLLESSRTFIPLHRNLVCVETTFANHSNAVLTVRARTEYSITDPLLMMKGDLEFETHDNLGVIRFHSDGPGEVRLRQDGAAVEHVWQIQGGDAVDLRTWLVFSDRFKYEDDVSAEEMGRILAENHTEWRRFWSVSSIDVGDPEVERFRAISLYTLRCQATPWSIPPTLSKPYWDGGAFHDEMYPFLALASGGHAELSRKIPYYRLATLPRAIERGRGLGALYPWSATERGEERDPHGHWYTERFHLGQIAASAWWYWLYSEDLVALDDLYPIIREVANYFENELLETGQDGKLRTKRCTDFDESVGQVAGGPMTMGAAIYSFERAAEAARRLNRDRERARRWERLEHQLRDAIFVDRNEKRYDVPDGKDLHCSICGLIAPFLVDTSGEYARNSVRAIHEGCRTPDGWKPGYGPVFDQTTWIWTAGHLGMCHSVLGDGEGAWECVQEGVHGASQFCSPNEHLNRDGVPVVPWFTTGCGAWLTAFHWMFVRVDDQGMHILPAVPLRLDTFHFRGLAGLAGTRVSCEVSKGQIRELGIESPVPQPVAFEIPKEWIGEEALALLGDLDDYGDKWRFRASLQPGENRLI